MRFKKLLSWTSVKRHFVKILLAKAVLTLSVVAVWPDGYLRPKTTAEFAKTSVMITRLDGKGGGTGVILKSQPGETEVLTNKHVCEVVENGGLVVREEKKYLVKAIKKATSHDLCLVKVGANLGVNTKIADKAPEKYSDAFVSGHPALFPHVLTKGAFSGNMIITMVGLRPCTEADKKDVRRGPYCELYGGLPLVETFDTQLVSGTVLPGSSGSAVFDKHGEIAGMVFASRSRELSYAIIVPHSYVKHFVEVEAPFIEWKNARPKENPKKEAEPTKEQRRAWIRDQHKFYPRR